jgi:hypothetical protein
VAIARLSINLCISKFTDTANILTANRGWQKCDDLNVSMVDGPIQNVRSLVRIDINSDYSKKNHTWSFTKKLVSSKFQLLVFAFN